MSLYSTRAYFRHLFKSRRWNSFHSPYLFGLFSYCSNEKVVYEKFPAIEATREKLKKEKTIISRSDLGAGSQAHQDTQQVMISHIARHALSLPFQCRFMSRLVHQEQSKNILEFGTSLGISTAYLHAGNLNAKIITVEGDPEIGRLAMKTFETLDAKNIQLTISSFDHFLKKISNDPASFDLIFIDGHHQSKALLYYYSELKKRISGNTIIIVDDIHWSPDMYAGWNQLIGLPEVKQSVDCFHFGLLFFRMEFFEKEHHIIRLPWQSLLG